MRAIVFGGPSWLAQRTLRSCARVGIEAIRTDRFPDESAWLLRAGTWIERAPREPPASATGRPLVAIGGPNGDLQSARSIPPIASAYVEKDAMAILREAPSLEEGIARSRSRLRVVRLPDFEARQSDVLRVMQITTSLQQGGAERIVIDLVHGLRARNVEVSIVLVGRPLRKSFVHPEGTIDLSTLRNKREQIDAIAEAVARFGPDVVHAHLLEGPLLEALAERGIECVTTVHNAKEGWPAGYDALPRLPLVIACANAVKAEIAGQTCRTIRNAIDPGSLQGHSLREKLGIAPDDLVIASVANPRPQKRLHLLADVGRALADRSKRNVHAIVAGAPFPPLQAEMDRAAISFHALGSLDDVGAAYRTANALVSTSAWEGLSLAQLEALACGTPVVATDVGGTREIPGVRTVPIDAEPDTYATAILEAQTTDAPTLPASFRTPAMVERHATLYRRVAACGKGAGLALVTNNFSTGGAQSSARRLLVALAKLGVPVRAFVVEEHPKHPTPGRTALEAEGVRVDAVTGDARAATNAILAALDEDRPAAVLFWNLIAEHKVLLADALVGVRVVDVSPGEMYFASLERYFEKPRLDVPYESPEDYGALLHAIVVKYEREIERARSVLGAPVRVIRNGIDPGPAPSPRSWNGERTLITTARLAPQKRLHDLVEAVRRLRLPKWELRIAGGPETGSQDYADSLRSETRDLPVTWLGERFDVRAELERADAFVMISEPAGCPNASLEAMAAGLPVVATDVGGANEQVIDGETGFLVPRGDPEAFARAIERLDPAMGTRGREHVERAFSMERFVNSYREVCGV